MPEDVEVPVPGVLESCLACYAGHCPVHRWTKVRWGMTTVHLPDARVTIRVDVEVRDPRGLGPEDPSIRTAAEVWGRQDVARMLQRAWPPSNPRHEE